MSGSHNSPISRQAIGRIARLGDLYDAVNEQFCGVSIFRQPLPPDSTAILRADDPEINSEFTSVSTLREKLHKMNVTGELQLSLLAGMCEGSGIAEFLSQKKDSFKSVECTLIYSTKTVTEHLELSHDQVKSTISEEAMCHRGATHVVIEIEWGAKCVIVVTDQNSKSDDKQEVAGKLKLQVDKIQSLVKIPGNAGANKTYDNADNKESFSFKIFGDVIPEESPHSLDGALLVMNKVPQLITKFNNGKGKPLSYVMLPLSSVAVKNPPPLLQTQRNIDETWTIQIVDLMDFITGKRQKVHDKFEEAANHSECITSNELEELRGVKKDLELQEASAKEELNKLLKEIRSDKDDMDCEKCLEEFRIRHFERAEGLFFQCDMIYQALQPRIIFVKRCRKFHVKYLTSPVDEHIAEVCDDYDNVYVLFLGWQADQRTAQKKKSKFIQLAKTNVDNHATACCFTWYEQKEIVKIKHYWKGNLVYKDVAKRLVTTEAIPGSPASKSSSEYIVPFTIRCPGSIGGKCSQDKRQWLCIQCGRELLLCVIDMALYCHCGHEHVLKFQFRCSCDEHGSDFKQFSQDTLKAAIRELECLNIKARAAAVILGWLQKH